jgi:hypothetical protein
VEVKVGRPHVTVRSRSEYAPAAPGSKPPSDLTAALHALVPVGDVALTVSVAPFLGADGRSPVLAVVVGIDQATAARRRALTDTAEVVVSAYDARGKPAGTVATHAQVGLPPGSQNVQYELLTPITLKPGRYEMRIAAATTQEAKAGSVTCDIEVPDFATDRLSLSGIVLSLEPGGFAAPRDALRSFLAVVPSSRRSFTGTDKVTALFRAYQGGKAALAPVSLRVAVLDANGATVTEDRTTLEADGFSRARTAERQFRLPCERLAPGSYLLTVDAALGDEVVRRSVRFDVR